MAYLGFSTFQNNGKTFQLSGKALVIRDILNHIYTLKGERVMLPDFGTRIPLIAFEPLDQLTLADIEDDLREVFSYDPRVELLDLAVMALPDNNAVVVLADLRYVELGGEVETLRLEFQAAN
jgi:phage baseplate assembly protein W